MKDMQKTLNMDKVQDALMDMNEHHDQMNDLYK